MEDYFVNITEKKLKIGNFVISCHRKGSGPGVELPFSAMAFYQRNETESDFHFLVSQPEFCGEECVIWGSSEFSIPTFLYELKNGEFEWRSDVSYRISSDWTQFTLYEDKTGDKGATAFKEFGSLFSYAILNRHACVLHGVVMEYNGMGILVTAASGVGKTTHTRMWRDRENALILNGDRCLCRNLNGVWYAYGMPWSGSSGEYINRRVPINAIVCLKQGTENRVRRMGAYEGTFALMQRIFAPVWQCDMQNHAFDMTEELAMKFPMLELTCLPDYRAVDVLKEAIENLGEVK